LDTISQSITRKHSQNDTQKKVKLLEILFIIVLVSLAVFFAVLIKDNFNAASFTTDSTIHVSIANSLLNNNGFTLGWLPPESIWIETDKTLRYVYQNKIDSLINDYSSVSQPYGGVPLFYIFEALFFKITDANAANWIDFGAIFSTLISSLFLITYYFFVRKYFGPAVAVISSIILVTSFFFLLSLTSVLIYPLAYLFLLLPLFFINQTNKNYILFGIFAGLATLVHQATVPLVYSYMAYLLFKKEFKGFILVISIWLSILTPWMVRQFQEFNDFGLGIGIPFSKQISSFLTIFTHDISSMNAGESFGFTLSTVLSNIPTPFEIVQTLFFNEHPHGLHKTELIVFFLIFVVFAFISFPKVKKKFSPKNVLIMIIIFGVISSSVFVIQTISESNRLEVVQYYFIQLGIIILLPLSLVIIPKYFVKNADIFEEKLPRIYVIISFFILFEILALHVITYQTFNVHWPLVFPLLLITLPLGIIGFKKVIDSVFNLKNRKLIHLLPYFIIIGIILPTSVVFSQETISYLNVCCIEKYQETEDTRPLHEWIRNNLDDNSVLMHERPGILFIHTGKSAVPIPDELNSNPFKILKYVKHFGVEYLVFYEPTSKDRLNAQIASFNPIYSCSKKCVVLKFNPKIDESDFTLAAKDTIKLYKYDVILIEKYMKDFERAMQKSTINEISFISETDDSDAVKLRNFYFQAILYEIEKFEEERKEQLRTIQLLEQMGKYIPALKRYDEMLETSNNIEALEGKIRIFKILDDKQAANRIYDEMYELYQERIRALSLKDPRLDFHNSNYLYAIQSEIKYWQSESSYYKLLDAYEEIFELDQFSEEAWYGKAKTLEKLDRIPEAINAYSYALQFTPSEKYEQIEEIENKINELSGK